MNNLEKLLAACKAAQAKGYKIVRGSYGYRGDGEKCCCPDVPADQKDDAAGKLAADLRKVITIVY